MASCWIGVLLMCVAASAHASAVSSDAAGERAGNRRVTLYPIPDEVRSNFFHVSVDGQSSEVMHAATGYYVLNFDAAAAVMVRVTASDAHFWDDGVEVQPMRFGVRPERRGATISFRMPASAKLTVTRPGDHFADAQILFLFSNAPDRSRITAGTAGVRYYGAGVHRENIDAHSGETIYLAGGAVIFGSLNVWQVHDVRVLGRGTIIYDGPQDPKSDEGWMQKPNWHVIVMDQARNVEIDGITCVTRSRSWQIQMRDSRHIGFYNVKAIAGNPNNANQDGMDWLGGGDTTVRNSFFRASDDVFAIDGNWGGYDLALMRVPGHDVTNIVIEDSIVSTSISNIVRVGWPEKTFNGAHFRMTDVDVIHGGFGGCKVPFALFELWSDPGGHGTHSDYLLRDIRLEDWYSLYQIRQPNASVRDVTLEDVWALDGPAMAPSVITGDVAGVRLAGTPVNEGTDGVVTVAPPAVDAHFTYTPGLLRAGEAVTFAAAVPGGAAEVDRSEPRYEWLFGDGQRAEGREVRHTFLDAEGTLLDGSGRFRVLLHVIGAGGEQAWSSRSVVLQQPASSNRERSIPAAKREESPGGSPDALASRSELEIDVPVDGGYTFTLLTSERGSLAVDDLPPHETPVARPQVCGSTGDAVQPVRVSATLRAGPHRLRVERIPGIENAEGPPGAAVGEPVLFWEGPGIELQPLPPSPKMD
ncbi:MAG TPA: hypothetical protein VGD59_04605 [Acidisarcina sp.]